jgi:pyridoxine/pyridoxamine 5'-phosphate oxidase
MTRTSLSDNSLAALVEQVASSDPAPGAGPSLAWSCALATALVEMAASVILRHAPADTPAIERCRDRAASLRASALALADEDVAAYTNVMAVLERREEPGHGTRLRDALSQAADPPLHIVEIAAEVARLAADVASHARGGVRGEAVTALVLGEAVVRAGISILELNLSGASGDSRLARARQLAHESDAELKRVLAPAARRRAGAPVDVARPLGLLSSWLKDAGEAGLAEHDSLAMVTVSEAGRPSARTVSLRRLEDDGLILTTALWTRKARELRDNPHVALLFHWPSLGRQVHVSGRAEPAERALAEEIDDLRLMRIRPDAIEYWEGSPDAVHDRMLLERVDDGWRLTRLSP